MRNTLYQICLSDFLIGLLFPLGAMGAQRTTGETTSLCYFSLERSDTESMEWTRLSRIQREKGVTSTSAIFYLLKEQGGNAIEETGRRALRGTY